MTDNRHARRRRRSRSSLGRLLPVSAVFLIGIMLAAALSPHRPAADDPDDTKQITDRLAENLADSVPDSPDQSVPLPAPASPVVPDWILQDILPVNEYSRPGTRLDTVNGVVVHYTGNPGTTAQQNRSYFGNLAATHETYASSHFIVGIDGTVIQCVPLDEVAYCSSSRNSDTISIECCHADESGVFSQDTLDSLNSLLNWLIDAYDLTRDDILRHYDVTGKECPYYYVKHPDAWTDLLEGLTF